MNETRAGDLLKSLLALKMLANGSNYEQIAEQLKYSTGNSARLAIKRAMNRWGRTVVNEIYIDSVMKVEVLLGRLDNAMEMASNGGDLKAVGRIADSTIRALTYRDNLFSIPQHMAAAVAESLKADRDGWPGIVLPEISKPDWEAIAESHRKATESLTQQLSSVADKMRSDETIKIGLSESE